MKRKYHGKKVSNAKRGINYEVRFFETDRCTELFFLFYFRYTGQNYATSKNIEDELSRICGYDKTQKFFRTHPLHQFLQKNGGNIANAIENGVRSEKAVSEGQRDYTYSELGSMFLELGINI